MPSTSLTFKRTLAVPPAEVFRAFTHATALRDWLCVGAHTEPRAGGGFYLRWDTHVWAVGDFHKFEPPTKLVLDWHYTGQPEPTELQIVLKEKAGHTHFTLKLAAFTGKKWAETNAAAQAFWEEALANLQSVLETGVDLRQANRPRLGIFIGDFNAEIAAKLGVPATRGLRLEGTAEGSGAHEAGLQKDDVLVRLGTQAIFDFPSLGRALHGQRAGDIAPIVYYRGAEKRKGALRFGAAPPATPLPTTGTELAEAARPLYAAFIADFTERLANVTEAEADRRPAPEEWNTKELLAHFIACERDLQSWMADMVNNNTIGDFLEFRPNVTPRLAQMVARYPTLPALLGELRAAADETLAFLAALPPTFMARKHYVQRVTDWVTRVVPIHLPEEHATQLAATLEHARQ